MECASRRAVALRAGLEGEVVTAVAPLSAFVDMVWPPLAGGFIPLRGFSEKGRPEQRPVLRWVEADDSKRVEKIAAFIRECDRLGIASYCIPGLVNGYGRANAADVIRIDTLVIDIDAGDIDETVRRLADDLGRPTMIIESGGLTPEGVPKRYVYWRLARPADVAKVCALRERLARAYGGDPSFGRAPQPIRLPTSTHRKAEPRPVTITFFDPENTIDPWQADVKLPPLDAATSVAGSGTLGFANKVSLDDLVMRRVGHGGVDITRFEALTRMAGMMISNIIDVNDPAEVAREFDFYRAWCRTHVENIERDYDLRQHWSRLLGRERAKRSSGRRFMRRRASA